MWMSEESRLGLGPALTTEAGVETVGQAVYYPVAPHGTERSDVMYNDFVIVGPRDDPAGIQGMPVGSDALDLIAASGATFASRGDDSGTHTKEKALWEAAGFSPDPDGDSYKSLGQGMGDTLNFSNEAGAYTLTDRGTFLSQQANLPNLAVMVGGAFPTVRGSTPPETSEWFGCSRLLPSDRQPSL